jgi:glutamine amidotransferase
MPLKESAPTVVVDYGLGNLASVARALRHLGSAAVISNDPATIEAASRLILPGVGAFGTAMANLHALGLTKPLQRYAASGRPLFGLCLGMQLLMETSTEGGHHEGLAILPGRVERLLPATGFKVPHVGWSGLEPTVAPQAHALLSGIDHGDALYFVHSYHVLPVEAGDALAFTRYGAFRYCSVIGRGRVFGCQAHPEKSSSVGLKILDNFLSL